MDVVIDDASRAPVSVFRVSILADSGPRRRYCVAVSGLIETRFATLDMPLET